MSFDISHLLNQWEYQPGKLSVRRFKGQDGSEKIQLRLDLGLLQMNAAGRPDGKRPYSRETLLDHFRAQKTKKGTAFKLTAEDCSRLHQEAIQYHHRYICLFQLEDYEGVIRDTERNLEALEFVTEHAGGDELAWPLRQFLPQLLMMQTRARASLKLQGNRFDEAIDIIEAGLDAIRTFYREHSRQELLEQSGELQSLDTWLAEIKLNRPLTEREKLEHALNEAVAREDFEQAAKVRDALRNLRQTTTE